MGFLRRKPPVSGPDAATLLLEGRDMIAQTAKAHHERWGLGLADRWDLDQTTGLLRWSFPDRTVEAPAQLLGTHSAISETWMWAWANDSFLPGLRTASEDVRRWGAVHGHSMLTTPMFTADAEHAADLAALGFRITRATGFYRALAGRSHVFMTFGAATIVGLDGRSQTFAINLG